MSTLKTIRTNVLEIAFLEEGPATGWPVVLAHGFPYDVHAYDEVAPQLAKAGARVITPYLRGFGPTRFLSAATMRSGQQAALGRDLIDLLDALGIQRAILAGYDWGGLSSCVASALWPERVTGLVSYAGYDIIDVQRLQHAFAPALEQVFWYQHLFQLERGRECLTQHRRALCRILWQQWSPGWTFNDATFERTASSFDNPDFVDVVIHCYRFCFGWRQATRLWPRSRSAPRREAQDQRPRDNIGWPAGSSQARRHGEPRDDVHGSSRASRRGLRPQSAVGSPRGFC